METSQLLMYVLLCVLVIITLKITVIPQKEIIEDLPNSGDAKLLLGNLREKAKKLIEYVSVKYPNDTGIKQLKDRFQPKELFEGRPGDVNFTYTENKGEKVVLCLRGLDLQLHSENLILFPLLHELAHIADTNYDPSHGDNFRKYFRLLLENANEIGIYHKIDFQKSPENYCGIDITGLP